MIWALARHAGAIVWKRRPLHLTLFLTRRCNAHCPFCFYLKSKDNPEPEEPELSLEEIRRVSVSLGRLLWLAFSGGEVYLRRDLLEISKAFYEQNKPAVMLYPSNGLLPELIRDRTASIAAACPKSVVVVKLSLDGVGSDHDTFRETPGGFGKLMQTYELLKGLLDHRPNFELGFNTVLTACNQDRIGDLIDFVAGLDPRVTHTITLVRGNLIDDEFREVAPDIYRQATDSLAARIRRKNGGLHRFSGGRWKAAQDQLQRRFIHRTLLGQGRSIPCYAGRLNLVLSETGRLYPCEILRESLGNVRDHDYDLARMTRTGRARDVLRSISPTNPQCRSCTHECNYVTNLLFDPSAYAGLIGEYLRLERTGSRGSPEGART